MSVAEAAAAAGFDQIMFDYVRFPSDGDVSSAVYPGKTSVPRGRVIEDFVSYAKKRLGATRARGSRPRSSGSPPRETSESARFRAGSRGTSTASLPMSYPVLYGGGELGLVTPSTQPGETVFRTLTDFRRQVKGSRAQLVPWVQDWNYTPQQVLAQIAAARLQGAKGYLLWNASGVYTKAALAPASAALEG